MIREHLISASQRVINFKRSHLSLLSSKKPVVVLGQTDVSALTAYLSELDVMNSAPGKSRGFCNMSELWLKNASDKLTPLDVLATPILKYVEFVVSIRLRQKMRVLKAVIDTIDETSCILPHCDDFFHHRLGLRVHIPLITSAKAVGLNFHPVSYDPTVWRMEKIGRIYAFNNFEPHTVTKLDDGHRAHLIMDLAVTNLTANTTATMHDIKEILFNHGGGSTPTNSDNFITHSNGNLTVRNILAERFGAPIHDSMFDQMASKNIEITHQWVQQLALDALLTSRVQVF